MQTRKCALGRKAMLALAAAGASASIANIAFGTEYTWTHADVSNNWSVAANWVSSDPIDHPPPPPNVPTPPDVTDLVFGGSYAASTISTQNIGTIEVNSIRLESQFTGTATLNISGSSTGDQFIFLGAGGLSGNVPGSAGNSGTVAITGGGNRRIILTADQTWSNNNTFGIVSQRRTMEGAFKVTKTGPGTIEFQANNSAWTGGLQIDQGVIRTSNFTNALGAGTITSNTANNTGISASGTNQFDQIVPGELILGGTGTFSLQGSWNVQFDNNVTLLSDKNVSVGNIGTFNGAIGGNFRLTKLGDGSMVLNAANTNAGFDVRAGDLVVSADDRLGAAGAAVGLGSSMTSQGTLLTGTVVATAPFTSSRNINILDADGGAVDTGTNAVSFGNVAGPGDFTKRGAGQLTVNHVRATDFAVRGGSVRIAPGATAGDPAGVSVVNTLALDDGGVPTPTPTTLDLTNNGLVVDYTGTSPFADIRSAIIAAYNGGAWDQPGLTSSSANNNTHGVAYAEASDVFSSFPASFMGQSVDNTSVLARHARYGDANLDGQVNLQDFNRLAANFGMASGAVWSQGDFNYDGLINLSDFNRLAANFGLQAGPDGPTPDDWAALASAIPEPGALGGVTVVGAALLGRRRRRC